MYREIITILLFVSLARSQNEGDCNAWVGNNARTCLFNDDRLVLQSIYNDMGGTGWVTSENWDFSVTGTGAWTNDPCDGNRRWVGVTCAVFQDAAYKYGSSGMEADRITRLIMSNRDLTGQMPESISTLEELQILWFEDNAITGPIPSFSNVRKLTSLRLNSNGLSGSIPSGSTELFNNFGLVDVVLYNNQLTGTIPTGFGSLTSMTELLIGENQLTGTLPVELAASATLSKLEVNNNALDGTIDPAFLEGELQTVFLGDNQFSGVFPQDIDTTQSEILRLEFQNNFFTCLFPPWLDQGSGIIFNAVGTNDFFCPYPAETDETLVPVCRAFSINSEYVYLLVGATHERIFQVLEDPGPDDTLFTCILSSGGLPGPCVVTYIAYEYTPSCTYRLQLSKTIGSTNYLVEIPLVGSGIALDGPDLGATGLRFDIEPYYSQVAPGYNNVELVLEVEAGNSKRLQQLLPLFLDTDCGDCQNGVCNKNTGVCSCLPGFSGEFCNITCPNCECEIGDDPDLLIGENMSRPERNAVLEGRIEYCSTWCTDNSVGPFLITYTINGTETGESDECSARGQCELVTEGVVADGYQCECNAGPSGNNIWDGSACQYAHCDTLSCDGADYKKKQTGPSGSCLNGECVCTDNEFLTYEGVQCEQLTKIWDCGVEKKGDLDAKRGANEFNIEKSTYKCKCADGWEQDEKKAKKDGVPNCDSKIPPIWPWILLFVIIGLILIGIAIAFFLKFKKFDPEKKRQEMEMAALNG